DPGARSCGRSPFLLQERTGRGAERPQPDANAELPGQILRFRDERRHRLSALFARPAMKRLSLLFAAVLPLCGQVTYERILHAESEPGNWLTYSGNYSGHRYSRLDQIQTGNVARLKPAWVYQVDVLHKIETTPLVVDGIM